MITPLRKSHMSFLIALGLSILGIGHPPASAQGGSIEERSFAHSGSSRNYLLYVPASYDGTQPWPLVINYHGFNGSANSQMRLSKMNAAADTANYLVAYPQGLRVNNPFLNIPGPGWNLIGGTLSENDDIDFSLELIDHIKKDYVIDPSRVHVTGWSMGAGMAYEIACAHADKIASLAAVAEQMDAGILGSCAPDRAMSFLQIHGTADSIIPFDGTEGGGIVFPSAPATASFWASLNNCSSDPIATEIENTVAEDSSTVTRIEYTGCDGESEVLFYRVDNGGHTWPGGGPSPFGFVNQDLHASAEILSFFERHPLSQITTAVVEAQNAAMPEAFALEQNYPNPFNSQTAIRFDLPKPGEVNLSVFDLAGQQVATLAEGHRDHGTYTLQWDGRDEVGRVLASGVYLYRLRAGGQLQTRKLLLLR